MSRDHRQLAFFVTLDLSSRLTLLHDQDTQPLVEKYSSVIKTIQATISTIAAADS